MNEEYVVKDENYYVNSVKLELEKLNVLFREAKEREGIEFEICIMEKVNEGHEKNNFFSSFNVDVVKLKISSARVNKTLKV